MKFNRIKSLLLGPTTTTEDPAETRARAILLTALAVLGPPLLLLIYYKTMFPGLTNSDAMDFAQIGRNLSAGHGFVTYVLRPLAIGQSSVSAIGQPDTIHGPLYPTLLALAFGMLHVSDRVVAGVSGLFYLLTVPVLYMLASRLFTTRVGFIVTTIYVFNALMLEYATSGLNITLYVFLMTWLMLAFYSLTTVAVSQEPANTKFVKPQSVLVGFIVAMLYLTDPIFAIVMVVMAGAMWWVSRTANGKGAFAPFLITMLVLTLPWMYRNFHLTGNPIYGLCGYEVWMYTKGYFPDQTAYRVFPSELVPGAGLLVSVVQKFLLGAGQIIEAFPQVTASWILAFFLPGLLFRFADPAATILRRILMLCFTAIFVSTLLMKIEMPLFVAFIPVMLIFALAYLLHLMQQAQLNKNASAFTSCLLAIAVTFPLVSDMTLTDKVGKSESESAAVALARMSNTNDVVFSDQPWVVAWYSDRPAIWLPVHDEAMPRLQRQYANVKWLFLTDEAAGFSDNWQYIYGLFRQWNVVTAKATEVGTTKPPALRVQGSGEPLYDALDGFISVPPAPNTSPNCVIAMDSKATGSQAAELPR